MLRHPYAAVDVMDGLCSTAPQPTGPSEPVLDGSTSNAVDVQPSLACVQSLQAAIESVRVAVDKLDALLAQAGERAVTHFRVRQRQRELRILRDAADASQREWRDPRALRISLRHGLHNAASWERCGISSSSGSSGARCSNASTNCPYNWAASRRNVVW